MTTQIVLVTEAADEYRDAEARAREYDLDSRIDGDLQPMLVDGVSAVVLAGAVAGLVKVIGDFIDKRRGGTIIDRTADPIRVTRDRGVPWGHVVIMFEDGTIEVEVHDAPEDALERWLTKLLELPKDALKAAAEALTDPLQPDDTAAAADAAG